MKQTIRLNERELHRLISESVKRVLNEDSDIYNFSDNKPQFDINSPEYKKEYDAHKSEYEKNQNALTDLQISHHYGTKFNGDHSIGKMSQNGIKNIRGRKKLQAFGHGNGIFDFRTVSSIVNMINNQIDINNLSIDTIYKYFPKFVKIDPYQKRYFSDELNYGRTKLSFIGFTDKHQDALLAIDINKEKLVAIPTTDFDYEPWMI